jgi:DNA-binding NarL/FixJ family response regulator
LREIKWQPSDEPFNFTTHQSDQLAGDVRNARAQGYVLKSQAARNLVAAIDTLLAGGTFFGAPPDGHPAKDEKSKPNISLQCLQFVRQGSLFEMHQPVACVMQSTAKIQGHA